MRHYGVYLSVDHKQLIRQVVIAPHASEPIGLAVRAVTQRFGLDPQIVEPSMFEMPPLDKLKFHDSP